MLEYEVFEGKQKKSSGDYSLEAIKYIHHEVINHPEEILQNKRAFLYPPSNKTVQVGTDFLYLSNAEAKNDIPLIHTKSLNIARKIEAIFNKKLDQMNGIVVIR
nr:hypothetical protein [Candidatus Sigynarchaeota archaeon]